MFFDDLFCFINNYPSFFQETDKNIFDYCFSAVFELLSVLNTFIMEVL